jgi:hypothetical protein
VIADVGGADVEFVAGAAEGSSANVSRPTTLDNATPSEATLSEAASTEAAISEVITSEFTTERAPIGDNEFHNQSFQGRIIDAFLGERQ